MLHLDTSFKRNYECHEVVDLPPDERLYFPNASTKGGRDGPIIRVVPHHSPPWIGVFAFGQITRNDGLTGLFTFPDPTVLCVVAKGSGYLVNVFNPSNWKSIDVFPICSVVPAPSKNLIVFGDYIELTAIDGSGLVWKTRRLAWSEMTITNVTEHQIEGETWDIRSEEIVRFRVDLETGNHTGGIIEP